MSQTPHADPGLDCPLHRLPMEQVCHKCPWWLQMRGLNRNTGVEVDNWGCAISFLPMLLIENSAQTRGAAAATEDARNQIVEVMQGAAQTMIGLAQNGERAKLITAAPQ